MKEFIVSFFIFLIALPTYSQQEKVLFIMSSADSLALNNNKKKRQTGIFLNEFYLAYQAIVSEGIQVEFSTPKGFSISIDQESLKEKYWKNNPDLYLEASKFIKENQVFLNPISTSLALENANDYIGLVVPGGQGVMVDVINDPNVPELLKSFAHKEKAIGLICHAPSLITTISKSENPFVGMSINCVTPIEEIFIEKVIMKGKPKNRKIAKQLKSLGLNYKRKKPKADFAVRDRFLVSSQNPFSGKSFNQLYIPLLKEELNSKNNVSSN